MYTRFDALKLEEMLTVHHSHHYTVLDALVQELLRQ